MQGLGQPGREKKVLNEVDDMKTPERILPSSVWGGFLQSLCVISDVPLKKKSKKEKSDSCSGCRQGAPGLLLNSGEAVHFSEF